MTINKEKARISIRTDTKLKDDDTKVIFNMQLDLTTAFNLLLDQVVEQNKFFFKITNETVEEKISKKFV